MKIGINGYYLKVLNSGLGQYSINLTQALAEIDKENQYYIFVVEPIQLQFPENFHVVVIRQLPFLGKTFLSRFIWEEIQLGNAIKKYGIEVFHALYPSLPRNCRKIGNVVTIHDAIPWKFSAEREQPTYRWYSDLKRYLLKRRAKKILAVSKTSKKDVAKIYNINPDRIEVTYESVNPVFEEHFSEEEKKRVLEKYQIDKEFLLYIGVLKKHKNLAALMETFEVLVKKYKFSGLLCVVGANKKNIAISPNLFYRVSDLLHIIRAEKVHEQVKFLDFIPEEELAVLMHASSCFVSVSLYEGFGLPAVEAMTSGIPSVLSKTGAYPEIAQDAAYFVSPTNAEEIAEALHSVLTDKNVREKLIAKGKKRAEFFDRKPIANHILNIYRESYRTTHN